jgi:hypothetical protein
MKIIHNLDEWDAFKRATNEVPEVFPVIGFLAEHYVFCGHDSSTYVSEFIEFPKTALKSAKKTKEYFEAFVVGYKLGVRNG